MEPKSSPGFSSYSTQDWTAYDICSVRCFWRLRGKAPGNLCKSEACLSWFQGAVLFLFFHSLCPPPKVGFDDPQDSMDWDGAIALLAAVDEEKVHLSVTKEAVGLRTGMPDSGCEDQSEQLDSALAAIDDT